MIYIKNTNIVDLFDEDIISLEELIEKLEEINDKYEELKRDLEDNYKPISKDEQYEIFDRDFY